MTRSGLGSLVSPQTGSELGTSITVFAEGRVSSSFLPGKRPTERHRQLIHPTWRSILEQPYRTKGRPFKLPDTDKIAVKPSNHYGDEVLRVYETQA